MSSRFNYSVFPSSVNTSQKHQAERHDYWWEGDFIGGTIIVTIIAIIVAIFNGGGFFWMLGVAMIVVNYFIVQSNNENADDSRTEEIIVGQKEKARNEADFLSQKFNSMLQKSEEIIIDILPYLEYSTVQSLNRAKIEFAQNVYSPFWSEIEEASKFLALYKEALNQLCLNSEMYNYILKKKSHNFPIPFPFGPNITIQESIIDDYKATIRKAQQDPTFSIIWEQRRGTSILISGFSTLENAIVNMKSELHSAINELQYSITSELQEMKFAQKTQLQNFESSQAYLLNTLNSMDNKLYYIQWKKKPLGMFHHR